ncbi:gamma-glutamyl-gamma-aminobutyrate hydrolase family protein [Vibrio alginolyticus]
MKRVGISHRVDVIPSYGERRDSIDQAWYKLMLSLGWLPVPLANIPANYIDTLMESLDLSGIILSGGNSITELDPNADDSAPERDQFEYALIQYALEHDLPLIGVCRGMQIINHYFGGAFKQVEGHIATQHELIHLSADYDLPTSVNSFHRWAIPSTGLASPLRAIASDNMGNIEAFTHESRPVLGIMWHPEREDVFNQLDINLLKRVIL